MNKEAALIVWARIKREIAALQEQEYELREELAKHILEGKDEGSKTGVVGNVKLTAQATINRSLDKNEFDLHHDEFTDEDWKAIKYVPQVDKKHFEKLPPSSKVLDCVKITQGKYQLRIVEDLAE